MNKIEQGILLNEQHIQNIAEHIPEKVSFVDQIKELGYKDLEEFFDCKREYEMQNVLNGNVYSVSPSNAMPTLRKLVENKHFGIVSVYTNETCVHHGKDSSKGLNTNYCNSHDIPIYEYDSFGGSIVATKGDYSFALLIPIKIDVSSKFILHHFKEILSKHFSGVEVQGNDIMIGGKKIAGTTNFETEDCFFLIAHFSMNEKSELIKAICGKPTSNKIPGYIDATVLSTEKLMKEILAWLQGL